MQTRAHYFDGQSSARHDVTLSLEKETLRLNGEGFSRSYPFNELRLSPPVGNFGRALRLADGGSCEIADPAFLTALEEILGSGFQSLVHRVESSLKYALLALVATVLLVVGFIQYGIPALAKVAAFSLPAETESLIGGESMELLERFYFDETELDAQRQDELLARFAAVVEDVEPDGNYRLLFRASEALGANALALPGGTVVVTDGLVELVEDDTEFAAVMAHEIGHLQRRHALRHVLQSMGTGMVVVALTGDLTSITSVAAALPTALVEAGFSREMEREADDAAAAWLHLTGHGVGLYGRFLKRLEEDHYARHPESQKTNDQVGDYFSTHPATRERIERLLAAEQVTQ